LIPLTRSTTSSRFLKIEVQDWEIFQRKVYRKSREWSVLCSYQVTGTDATEGLNPRRFEEKKFLVPVHVRYGWMFLLKNQIWKGFKVILARRIDVIIVAGKIVFFFLVGNNVRTVIAICKKWDNFFKNNFYLKIY
jgi:hypothetical protein